MKLACAVLLVLALVILMPATVHDQAASRTLVIATTEVTNPGLVVTPDGESLIFTALGHLMRVPIAGGEATQLTRGLSYDSDPAISPDGTRVAFASNRDGSGSNIFVLDLADGNVTQLTHDVESVRPAWSPDGRTVAYLRNLAREDHSMDTIPGFRDTGLRELRTIPATGGEPTIVEAPKPFETIFYLPDGRLGWTVTEQRRGGMSPTITGTRVEVRGDAGSPVVRARADGNIGRVVPGPKGDGVYYAADNAVRWLPFDAVGSPVTIAPVQDEWARMSVPRVAVSRDGATLYVGDRGGIWRVPLPSGEPQPVRFTAAVAVDVRPIVPALRWTPPSATPGAASLRPVLAPQISPDGTRLVFVAGGFLWEQPVSGGAPAHRLLETAAFDRDPVFSPDGTQLAFAASEDGTRQLRVYDFASRRTRALFTVGGASWAMYPSWSPDGKRIAFQYTTGIFAPYRLMSVDVASGEAKEIARTTGSWTARPQFSSDGRSLYYTARVEKFAALYRLPLEADASPQALTNLTRHVHEAQVSPDGRWMAFRRNSEIMLAPMAAAPIADAQVRRFSAEGGRSFAFAPDSSAIVYTARGRVWRQPVAEGQRVEIPVQATLPRAIAPPLLVTRVHVLDLESGRFGDETSLFVDAGRIRWIGSEQGHAIPPETVRLDGVGRYAIPGLFDLHVHSAWANQQTNEDAFIAFGLTSVRDTGGTMGVLTALDDRSDITSLPAPRYFYSGEIFEGLMPLWGDAFYQIANEAEARAEARNLKAAGARFLKIYPSLPWNLQQAVADEGHKLGLPLVGHGVSPEEIIRRVQMGFSSVEHNPGIIASYGDIRKLLAAAGTAVDATLNVGGGALMNASDPDWQDDWLAQEYVPEEVRPRRTARPGATAPSVQRLLDASAPRFAKLRAAQQDGVTMLAGTDSMMGGVCFGLALHREIAQFVDAGFTPIDALRMATIDAAAAVGAASELGSIAEGKLADLVLLDASPLENIRNTQTIWRVVKGGRVYDPKTMRSE